MMILSYLFPNNETTAIMFILMATVLLVIGLWLVKEVQDNSPRKGLRDPKIAIPVGVFLLYLSGISDTFTSFFYDPFMFLLNPSLILGFGFTSIGVIALYKEHKDGVA